MEHLKQATLQTYIWKQSLEQNKKMPSIEVIGWKDKEVRITPVWFLAEKLTLCHSQKRRIKPKDGYIADSKEQEKDLSY